MLTFFNFVSLTVIGLLNFKALDAITPPPTATPTDVPTESPTDAPTVSCPGAFAYPDLSYQTIGSIEICSSTTVQIGTSDIDGVYTWNGDTSTPSDYSLNGDDANSAGFFLPLTENSGKNLEFGVDTSNNRFYFGDVDSGIRLEFNGPDGEIMFVERLIEESDCNCDTGTYATLSHMYLTSTSGATLSGQIHACATIVKVNPPYNGLYYDPACWTRDVYNAGNFFGTPFGYVDNKYYWGCTPETLSLCNDLSNWLGINYMGIEVFDDYADGVCTEIARNAFIDDRGFRCKNNKCKTGYRQFANGEGGYPPAGRNVQHKCRHEATYFPNCEKYGNRGCKVCDVDYELRDATWPSWGNFCPYGYCIYNNGATQPTPSPGVTPRECWKQADRTAKVGGVYVDNDYGIGQYWISDPWNQTECIKGAISGDIAYCIEDGLCDHGLSQTGTIVSDNNAGCHIDGSCSQCLDQPYSNFKISRFHRCQNVASTFGEGCILANEGYGCGQCDGFNVETKWSEYNQVWYCPKDGVDSSDTENVNVNPAFYTTNTQDKYYSPWKCPVQYDPNLTGDFLFANGEAYGIDCDVDGQCLDCNPGELCGQCVNDNSGSVYFSEGDDEHPATGDWFRPSDFHTCQNCDETFGHACLFCDDYRGCSQCKDTFILQYDACCDLWYCI